MVKSRLDDLLDKKPGSGELRKPRGVTLSTDLAEQNSAQVHKSTSALGIVRQNIRPSKGYKIRADIARECKSFAAEKDRPLYEIMEEALIQYLQKNGRNIR